jgi:prolipoprotein diacylglyceryltransferase/protein-S-isoprenylcysteine O-methyltransferase Ste14
MTVAPSSVRAAAPIAGRAGYAALFMFALPVLLVCWAIRLDEWVRLPMFGPTWAGYLLALTGAGLMAEGMRDLWVYGHGLPASPFPPERFVASGAYRFIAHPIYLGASLISFGVSSFTRSAAGFWIVSPTLALAAAAFVVGFERDATRRRFGTAATPLLRLPAVGTEPPAVSDRFSVYLLVFLPWLVLYQAIESLGVPPDATPAHFAWEIRLPVLPWTEAIYAATYLFVLAAPLAARRVGDLRTFALGGLWATAVIIPVYLLVPLIAPARPVPGDGLWQSVMRWERAFDGPVTAFPAFHVVWACLAAQLWTQSRPRLRPVWSGLAAAIAVSCITTGMHAIADVVAGGAAYVVVARRQTLWRRICEGAEWIANAWGEMCIGPVRLLSHGISAAIGAMVGVLIAVRLAGPDSAGWIFGITMAVVIGAGLWAQVVEGSPLLLRPYGYFGSVAGAAVASAAASAAGADGWLMFTAVGVGSTFAQAIGRMRCLTQGCCHGREADASIGVRYRHPRSRVVRLTSMSGKPLHPTPVYSAVWMLLVGAVLWRLWTLAAPLQFIAGMYFILTGLGRFVEEHYRGEPQTAIVGGLRLYQWLAIAFVVGGAALTTVGPEPAPASQPLDSTLVPMLVGTGVVTYVAYGVDFPTSKRRFSRLV